MPRATAPAAGTAQEQAVDRHHLRPNIVALPGHCTACATTRRPAHRRTTLPPPAAARRHQRAPATPYPGRQNRSRTGGCSTRPGQGGRTRDAGKEFSRPRAVGQASSDRRATLVAGASFISRSASRRNTLPSFPPARIASAYASLADGRISDRRCSVRHSRQFSNTDAGSDPLRYQVVASDSPKKKLSINSV